MGEAMASICAVPMYTNTKSVYKYNHIYIYIYTYIYIYIHTHVTVYICTYVHIHTCTHFGISIQTLDYIIYLDTSLIHMVDLYICAVYDVYKHMLYVKTYIYIYMYTHYIYSYYNYNCVYICTHAVYARHKHTHTYVYIIIYVYTHRDTTKKFWSHLDSSNQTFPTTTHHFGMKLSDGPVQRREQKQLETWAPHDWKNLLDLASQDFANVQKSSKIAFVAATWLLPCFLQEDPAISWM